MPIRNDLFGIWKVFSYYVPSLGTTKYFVVESADEAVSQNIEVKPYIIGTAMPRALEISGASAELNINAPLLVSDTTARTGTFSDYVNDGLTLVSNLGAATYMSGTYTADPGFIYRSINFSVSDEQGATYKIAALGDYDSLHTENTAATAQFGITTPTSSSQYPMTTGHVFRVASFYDFDVSLGGWTLGTNQFLRELNVDITYQTQEFSWVGQPDQRKYFGISGMEIKVSGTIISQSRYPTGHYMPLQAEKTGMTLPSPSATYPYLGGLAHPTTGSFSVLLRNGAGGATLDVLPVTTLSGQKFVFSSSSLQASTGLLTTQFEGQMWAQTNS